ncbi:hypothetical protein BH24BAC1_BH24BAC1_20120 [soil metagenome]
MKKLLSLLLIVVLCTGSFAGKGIAQEKPMSERMAQMVMTIWADSMTFKPNRPVNWNYEMGLVLTSLGRVWHRTGESQYVPYMRKIMDHFVQNDGSIRTYRPDEYNIDHVASGRVLLLLATELNQEKERQKYKAAADRLMEQLKMHPRTKEGGLWHKKIYPHQMWLDGLYMGQPFVAEYAKLYNQQALFDDVAKQFRLMEQHSRDPKTGLLYHGWDESREQKWADKKTGRSPNVWGRAMGWYGMALVDVLDHFPQDHPQRKELEANFRRFAEAVVKYQDKKTGVWYQVVDKGSTKGNYLEASGSSMFVYALAKGARKGYLGKSFAAAAQRGYQGLLKTFVETDAKGLPHLNGIVSVAGLGGNPYRDGSFAYYISEKVVQDDPKGVGPFIMASVEVEMMPEQALGQGKRVGLDYFFNHEYRKNAKGEKERFHYTWEDQAWSGFSLWGHTFEQHGASLVSVPEAPTAATLQGLDLYIIVDPDTPKETEKPNYVGPAHIQAITDWVKAGGVLVLMANDSANVELKHFNRLAQQFGIQFNHDNLNPVLNRQFEMGRILIPENHPVFPGTKKVYLKEIASLSLQEPAKPLLLHNGHIVMAQAKVGKGTVFAVGDPWLYNEYVGGWLLSNDFENFRAGKQLAGWLLEQAKKPQVTP